MNIIHFHVHATSIEDLKRQLREALGEITPTIDPKLLETAAAPVEPAKEPQPEQPKAEPETQAEPEQPTKTYTLAEVRAAANTYRDKHGIEALREIFKKHGGEKLKDIPESSYAALMEEIA